MANITDVADVTAYRELEYRRQIDQLTQPDLVTVFCAAVAALDDEHLCQAIRQMPDDDLGTLVAYGILGQREREKGSGFYGFDSESIQQQPHHSNLAAELYSGDPGDENDDNYTMQVQVTEDRQ